jgi:hypothetical protein
MAFMLLLQETADGELIILHDFHLADAFPDTGPNVEPYKQLRAQVGPNTPLLIKVRPTGLPGVTSIMRVTALCCSFCKSGSESMSGRMQHLMAGVCI